MNFTRRSFLTLAAGGAACHALTRHPLLAASAEPGHVWINKHRNVTERVWRHYDAWNHIEGTSPALADDWRIGRDRLLAILDEAQAANRRVRAVGAGWSLSRCAVSPDIMVNTAPLNAHSVGLGPDDVVATAVDPARLVFAQCGTGVRELSGSLEARGLSLPTSGASNGQTICGAISTGTHGSARRVGSMQDCVLGLHLLAADGRQYWIERASRPVVSASFCERLGATLRRDDRLFRAAVVSFGSFGIIHAVLLEAAPGFLLEVHRRRLDWPRVAAHAAATLDTDGLGLPYSGVEPFHFDVWVNPYRSRRGDAGALVTAMYKKPLQPIERRPAKEIEMMPGVDLLAMSGRLAHLLPRAIPLGVNAMFKSLMTDRALLGTPGEVFATPPMIGDSLSSEIGVDLTRAREAIELLIDTAGRYPFPGLFGLRYVQRSDALLAFTRFETTCTIEMTGAGGSRTQAFYRKAWAALETARIPFTMHWGKVNDTSRRNLSSRWGASAAEWLDARRSLLSSAGRAMFSNDLLEHCGLAE